MSYGKTFGIFLMYLTILGNNVGISEWVELPQFSDEKRVYRGSFAQYDREKVLQEGQFNARKYAFPNSSERFFEIRKNPVAVTLQPNLKMTSMTSEVFGTEIYEKRPKVTTVSIDLDDDDDDETVVHEDDDDDNMEIEIENPESNDEDIIVTVRTNSSEEFSSTPAPLPEKTEKKSSFWDFLPLEFFKKIHNIFLKNQAKSVQGKIGFMKSLETTLLNEIESRLNPIVNPVRKKRGSGWDEHDEHVGFPSLEGALLAISFLTFAVYLVQLIMMLFKNLGNNTMQPQSTFVVSRNKRFLNEISEESARVLNYLDKFSNNEVSH